MTDQIARLEKNDRISTCCSSGPIVIHLPHDALSVNWSVNFQPCAFSQLALLALYRMQPNSEAFRDIMTNH